MTYTPPSSNFQILYQADHQKRALALSSKAQLVSLPARTIPALDTLVFWGHGTQGTLCAMTADQIADVVKSWKASNKKLATVEILTCNSRHAAEGQNPFVAQLRSKLGFLLRNVKIKSMPIRMGAGGVHGDSILFADDSSRTWCYITAPSEKALQAIRGLFKEICEKQHEEDAVRTGLFLTTPPPFRANEPPAANPFPKIVPDIAALHENGKVQAWLAPKPPPATGPNEPRFMQDLLNALADDSFRRAFITSRKYSMNYGTFAHLRDQLATTS